MKLLYLLIALCLAMPLQPKDPFKKFTGTWKRDGEDSFEVWENSVDGRYVSRMFRVRNGDTVLLEKVETYREGKVWVYAVTGADNDTTVKFRSVSVTDRSVVFTNPAHDFPQVISYTLERPHRLRAYVAAGRDTVRFNFVKQ